MDRKKGPVSINNMISSNKRVLYLLMALISAILTVEAMTFGEQENVAPGVSASFRPSRERLVRGKAMYNYFCSPCHGPRGNGLGPNAKYLSKRPRNFTDGAYMDTKSNRDLYQVIKGGGSSVGLSFLMPPWGKTLSEQEIFDLIVSVRSFEKQAQNNRNAFAVIEQEHELK